MGFETDKNLSRAWNLATQLTEAEATAGCLEVAMNALGARVGLTETLNRIDILTKHNHYLYSYLESYGLQAVASARMDSEVTEEEIKKLVNNHKTLFVDEGIAPPQRMIKGILILFESPNELDRGHAIAIIHRDNLGRNDRKELRRNERHLLVDTQYDDVLLSIGYKDLTESLNRGFLNGYNVSIYFLKKKRQQR